jgi:hypothetical protein
MKNFIGKSACDGKFRAAMNFTTAAFQYALIQWLMGFDGGLINHDQAKFGPDKEARI